MGISYTPRRYQASVTKPLLTDLAWVNQGDATAANGAGGISQVVPANAAANLRILKRAAPTAPYSVYLRYYPLANATNTLQFGLVLRNSTSGRLLYLSNFVTTVYTMNRGWQRYTSPTAFSATIDQDRQWVPAVWMKIDVTATTATPWVGPDGWSWFTAGPAETLATFINAAGGATDEIGFAAMPVNDDAGYQVSVLTTSTPH